MEEVFKHIEKDVMDRRKYRKSIRKQFDRFEMLLRFRKDVENLKLYKKSTTDIKDVLFRTLDNDKTYETRNLYFLFAIMETHFTYYGDMLIRMKDRNDESSLKLSHEAIFQKNAELLNVLIDNKKNPVTVEQLEQAMENKKNDR